MKLTHFYRTVPNIYTCNNAYADVFQTDFG